MKFYNRETETAKLREIRTLSYEDHSRRVMKYIKITEEQTALELMSHPYFSGKQASE